MSAALPFHIIHLTPRGRTIIARFRDEEFAFTSWRAIPQEKRAPLRLVSWQSGREEILATSKGERPTDGETETVTR